MRALPEDHDPEHTAEMYECYQQGLSMREVGRKFCLSATTVGRRFRASGLERRPSGLPQPTQEQVAEWRRLRVDEGLSYAEIGARSAMAGWTVRKHLLQLQREAS